MAFKTSLTDESKKLLGIFSVANGCRNNTEAINKLIVYFKPQIKRMIR